MKKFFNNDHCFVCGKKNLQGLNLQFEYEKDTNLVKADIIFPDHFQGWAGVVHGGLISTALDEIMVKATETKGLICVTAEIFVKFKNPAYTKNKYLCSGKIIDIKKKLVFTESKITDGDKKIIATGRAKLFIVGEKQYSS